MKEERRKICWVTPDYFYNIDVAMVEALWPEYRIEWIIVKTVTSYFGQEEELPSGRDAELFKLKFRQRDPRVIGEYLRLIQRIRESNPDLIYISFHGLPYFMPLFLTLIDRDKILYAAHNVSTPKGAAHEYFMRLYHDYLVKRVRFVHVFSRSQLKLLLELKVERECFYAPLTIEDHGPSTRTPPEDRIRFLFFGNIRKYKRVDLLIGAFNQLCKTVENVELWIAGNSDNWQPYQELIAGNPRIQPRIGIVPNEEIADLFSSCHYVVLPYQDIAQSGVLPLAYNYGKPVIASNLEGFREFVDEGATGFFFTAGSQDSLVSVMADLVRRHSSIYSTLIANVAALVEKEYSVAEVAKKYRQFLDHCIGRRETGRNCAAKEKMS